MINPSQSSGPGAVKVVEQTTPASVASVSARRSVVQTSDVVPQQDTAEVSASAQKFEALAGVLRQTPDVRPDVVSESRGLIQDRKAFYPPLDIIRGIGVLIGNGLKPAELPEETQ